MIQLGMPIPFEHYVACSGGVDSMAVLGFLSRRKYKPKVAYFDHGTEHGKEAKTFVLDYCRDNGLEVVTGECQRPREEGENKEAYWREQRYLFLHGLSLPIVMCHHLDDCVENWVYSCLHGKPGVVPVRNRTVIRPFLMTKKSSLLAYCQEKRIPWVQDPSNDDTSFMRNHIRHTLMPGLTKVNPGLQKTVMKIVRQKYEDDKQVLLS
jgi:tRNA(Ile)-lysidine synthetase-like protein